MQSASLQGIQDYSSRNQPKSCKDSGNFDLTEQWLILKIVYEKVDSEWISKYRTLFISYTSKNEHKIKKCFVYGLIIILFSGLYISSWVFKEKTNKCHYLFVWRELTNLTFEVTKSGYNVHTG